MVRNTIGSGPRHRLKPRDSLRVELKPGTSGSLTGQGDPAPKRDSRLEKGRDGARSLAA